MTKQEFKHNYRLFKICFVSFFNNKFTIKKTKTLIKAVGEYETFIVKKDNIYLLSTETKKTYAQLPLKLALQLDYFNQFFDLIRQLK